MLKFNAQIKIINKKPYRLNIKRFNKRHFNEVKVLKAINMLVRK